MAGEEGQDKAAAVTAAEMKAKQPVTALACQSSTRTGNSARD